MSYSDILSKESQSQPSPWAARTADNADQMNRAGNAVDGTGLSHVSDLAPEVADATARPPGNPPPSSGGGFHPFRAAWHGLMVAADYWNRDVYQPFIDDPLVGLNLMLAAPVARAKDESLGDYLRYSWNQRKTLSLGQSNAAVQEEYRQGATSDQSTVFHDPIHNIDAYKEHLNPTVVDEPTIDPVTGQSVPHSHQQINWGTGTIDFVASLGLDPLNYVGGPVKGVTTGLTAPRIVDNIGKTQTAWSKAKGVISVDRVNELLDKGEMDSVLRRFQDITDPKVARAYADSLKLGLDDPDTFSYLASKIDTVEGQKDLFTLSLRPTSQDGLDAAARLRKDHGADLAYYAEKYAGNDPLLADALRSAGDLLLSPKVQEIMDAVVKNADVENSAALSRALSFSQGLYKTTTQYPGGSLRNAPTVNRAFEKYAFRAAARKTAKISDDPVVTQYKPHRWHPTVWYIEKPAGLVEPGSADAFNEIDATMRQLDRLTNGEFTAKRVAEDGSELPSRAAEFTDRWFRAGTLVNPEDARARVAGALNEYALNKLIKIRHPDVTPAQRKDLIATVTEKAKKVRQQIDEKGWLSAMTDEGGIGIIRYPALQRATPNAVSMYDLRALDRALQREAPGALRARALALMEGSTTALDDVMGIWKVSVLMRLGYPLRNLAEAGLSIWATGNVGNILSEVGPERMKTWGEATGRAGARLIDHTGVASGVLDTPQALWDQRQAWDGALAATNASAEQMIANVQLSDKKLAKLAASSDPADQEMARRLMEAKMTLTAQDTTYHANYVQNVFGQPANWKPARGRALSTTKSQTLAQANVAGVPGQPIPEQHAWAPGQRFFYHGTSQRILGQPENHVYETRNIFGQGLYTTDDLRVAAAYRKKGRGTDPAVHQITQAENVRWYDLEAPLDHRIRDWLNDIKDSSDTAADVLTDVESGKLKTGAQVLNEMRGRAAANLEDPDTIQDWFDSLRAGLEQEGFGGYSHLGGAMAGGGKQLHNVRIWWFPDRQLKMDTVDMSPYEATAGGFVHAVTSHGETLDLTTGPAPKGLDPTLVAAAKAGDQASVQRVSDAAWTQGYGRIVLPDTAEWGGQQVIVNQRAVGPGAQKRAVGNRLRQLISEAEQTTADVPAIAAPKGRRRMRQESKAVRGPKAKARPIPLAVNPDYENDLNQAMLNGGLKEFTQALADRRAAIGNQIDYLSLRHAAAQARRSNRWAAPARTVGRGFQQGAHEFQSRGGINYGQVGDVFGGDSGGWWESAMSADTTYSTTTGDSYRGLVAGGAMVSKEVAPANPRYFEAWANVLNLHFRDFQSGVIDPVVEKIIGGQSFDDIYDWAIGTPEGYQWAHGLGITEIDKGVRPKLKTVADLEDADTVEKTVASLMSAVNLYLPEGSIRDAFAAGQDIDQELLRAASKGETLHPLQARLIPSSAEAAAERDLVAKGRHGIAQTMKVLGSIPESSFARHPLFAALFHEERRNLVAIAEEARLARGEEARLTPAEWNRITDQARKRAQRTTESTLFTSNRRSTISGNAAVRALYPFVSAYENVIQRWSKFIVADPSVPLRGASLVQKASQPALIVDGDGNPVTAKDYTGEEFLVLSGKALSHLPGGLGKAAAVLATELHIPTKSLDVMTQGQPLNPGLGPLVIMPMAALMRRQPSAEQYLKWAMPYGAPQTNLEALMPTALKYATKLQGDSQQYANMISKANLILTDRWEKGGRKGPEPTTADAEKMAQSMKQLRIATSMVSPFAMSFTSEKDFYAGKLRSYQQKWGQDDGETYFYQDFPSAGLLIESLSKNPSGVRAATKAVDNANRYGAEVEKAYGDLSPDVAGFIMNYGVPDDADFSQAAYQWQRSHGPSGTTGQPFRQVGEPNVQPTEAHIRTGWNYYRQVIDGAEAQLHMNGLQAGDRAFDDVMTGIRGAVADYLGNELGNKAWLRDFENPDTSKYDRRADEFKVLLNNTQFAQDHAGDTLVQSMQTFFALRDSAQQELARRDAAGGASTLDAKGNADLNGGYQAMVDKLKADSPEFTAWYSRFFSFDAVKAA